MQKINWDLCNFLLLMPTIATNFDADDVDGENELL
jgi:hypothetical protein